MLEVANQRFYLAFLRNKDRIKDQIKEQEKELKLQIQL